MSPEQITSAKDVDARSDLWSAGVMFYEMLTGRTAFPAPTEYARLSAVLQSEPDPIERVDPQLLPMAAFLARALRKDRTQRFQKAAEMAHALERASTGQEPSNSRISFMPLSRLPDRPWITAPTGTTPADVSIVSTDPAAPPTPLVADDGAATRVDLLPQSPGGTLASTPGAPHTPAPKINVVVVKPAEPKGTGGTLTSQESRAPKKRSVVLGWVVVFVAVALTAGICVGFLLGRAY
jgi:serine/threonine-protein kinase